MPDSNLLRNMKANAYILKLCRKFFVDFLQQLVCLFHSCFLPDKAVLTRIGFDFCPVYESCFKAEQTTLVQQ